MRTYRRRRSAASSASWGASVVSAGIARVYVRGMLVRLAQLYVGLVLYGISSSLLVLANLGLDPWDVFHQGLSRTFGLAIGTWAIIVGVVVLLFWIPLRPGPGVGAGGNG